MGGRRQCRVQIARAGGSGSGPTGPGVSSSSFGGGGEQTEGKAAIFSGCPTGPEVRKRNCIFFFFKSPRRERIKGANKTTQSHWLCNGMTVMSQPVPLIAEDEGVVVTRGG